MRTNNYETYQTVNLNSAMAMCFSRAKMQMCVSFSFFLPSFHLKLGSLLNSVVSRCPSDGDKENERGLDIISIAMSLLSMPLVRRSHSAGSSHCTTFSTCKWQCHQMLSFHQSSRGGHEYTKGKAEAGCLPLLYLAQLYRLSFLLWASTFCFHPKGYSPAKPPGSIKVGHAYWTSQVDCKCKLNVDTKCHPFFFFYIISAGGQRQQGSTLQPLFIHVHKSPSPYPNLTPDSSAAVPPKPQALPSSLSLSLLQPVCPLLYPSCQIILVN